ncbi:hypothetical protein R3P38DRAFT_3105775, partial [Favolaschia claudopus]
MPRAATDELSDDVCPRCQTAFLTVPKPCVGFFNPKNEDRVYQHVMTAIPLSAALCLLEFALQCQLNTFGDDRLCSGFFWCEKLGPTPSQTDMSSSVPATPQKRTPCISPRCSSAPKARPASKKCSQTFCKDCCLGSSTQCRVVDHNPRSPSVST